MVEKRKYADRREKLIRAVAKRRRKIKLMAIEKLKSALRSFQKKFWKENLGITVKPYSNRAIPWEPSTQLFECSGAVETRYRDA